MTPSATLLERSVSAHLEADVTAGTEILMAIAVDERYERIDERLHVDVGGERVEVAELPGTSGTRFHLVKDLPEGPLIVDYEASVRGILEQSSADDLERFRYLRPSRYCEADRIGGFARAEFGGLESFALVEAVRAWINTNIDYALGASRPTDGALDTLLERAGACRDSAHLAVALLRARDVPARVASVYSPGLVPMDFHAVVEACVDGLWYVIDPTGLAPRPSMVRIAAGVDASETAFLTSVGGSLTLTGIAVHAHTSAETLDDDGGLTYLW